MIRLKSQIGWLAQCKCNTVLRMHDPECSGDCKHHRGKDTAVILRKYGFSDVYKSIEIAIVYRDVHRYFTTILMVSQKPEPIPSVASDGASNINIATVSLNIILHSTSKLGRGSSKKFKLNYRFKSMKSKIKG